MLKLLERTTGLNRGGLVDYNLTRYVKLQAQGLRQMQRYYRDHYIPLDMTNPLVRLVYRMGWDESHSPYDYFNIANESVETLAASIKMTSSFNVGEVHYGPFYGEDVPCALVSSPNDKWRLRLFSSVDWEELAPVQVLTTPVTDQAFVRPDLVDGQGGYAVVAVDIPLLAFQLRSWSIINNALPIEERQRPEHFLARYVFPNMMASQMDAILVSRLNGQPGTRQGDDFSSVLAVVDYTEKLSNQLQALLDKVVQGDAAFERILQHIPSFVGETRADTLPVIYGRQSSNNAWAQLAASLGLADLCAQLGQGNREWPDLRNIFTREDRTMRNNRTIEKTPDTKFEQALKFHYGNFKNTMTS